MPCEAFKWTAESQFKKQHGRASSCEKEQSTVLSSLPQQYQPKRRRLKIVAKVVCIYNVVVVVVYFILSRLLYLAFSANLGLLCMPHPGIGPLV